MAIPRAEALAARTARYRARKFEISEDFSDLPPPKSKAAAAGLCGAAEPESDVLRADMR